MARDADSAAILVLSAILYIIIIIIYYLLYYALLFDKQTKSNPTTERVLSPLHPSTAFLHVFYLTLIR